MKERTWRTGAVLVLAASAFLPACSRKQPAEINPIAPSVTINRTKAPLGSAIEVTYTWTLDPNAKKLTQDYRALVHFLDAHKVVLFTDDHVPTPPVTSWEPGKSYSYSRTVFIPVYPYLGEVQVVMGLYPAAGRGERVAMKGEDIGLRAYKVAKMEFLPQTDNIFLVYKEGWHSPETSPQNPGLERTWSKKEALVSFKNPKKDVILYLEGDTNSKAFSQPPVLTVSVGGTTGLEIPIENSEVFLKKIRFKAEALGAGEWVDLRLAMNESFVPKAKGLNQDDRELGLLVYHLFVGEADKLGTITGTPVVDAGPVAAPAPPAAPAVGKTPAGKPAAKTPPAKAPAKPSAPPKK
jgi:hypothetical protein